ncbi:cystatin-like protein [Anopheles ziemanni]|uniref:cystatin-like protein n=1 Tax=Anopheles coustani TaxID=139045 RepID=UPI002657F47B|nr:cystatin-like protein [Anopheles coustani]XP_058173516.1 cystatin-like protein [Anopheles ziemanni]
MSEKPVLCGGVAEDSDHDSAEHAERIVAALASTDGHAGKTYKLHRVTKQVVAGMLFTYIISFENDESGQQYKITVWDRPWLKESQPDEALKITFEKHT